jgi:DNA (cytosine-5)-methyltransferase 1
MTSHRPTVIDLFAGAGGLSLGFEQAGFDVLAAVEYDPIHAATHAFNFPATKVVCADASDVTTADLLNAADIGWRLHRRRGKWNRQVDVLIGGPPCQGFSTGGKRQADDARNKLVFAFARLVGELQPRYFVMENVQGLASFLADERGERLLDVLVRTLQTYGYAVARPAILNACAFGVPQDRRRLFLVGARTGECLPNLPTPTTRGRVRRPGAPMPTGANFDGLPPCPSVWEAIGDLPDLDRFPRLIASDAVELDPATEGAMDTEASAYARVLRGLDIPPDDFGYPRSWDPGLLTSSCRTTHTDTVRHRFASTAQGSTEKVSRFVRLHLDGIAPTLRAGTHYERGSFNAPRPIHPTIDRVISVREAARLHSFPDWFRLHWTKWHGFRQVGNSVAPRIGRAVAAELLAALGEAPAQPVRTLELGDPSLLLLENNAAAELFKADPSRMPRNSQRTRRPTPIEDAEAA